MGGKKLSIEIAQKIAQLQQGNCLSTSYENCEVPLLWECKYKHIWKACLNSIKNSKTWCSKCAKIRSSEKQRGCLDDVLGIVKRRGGTCFTKKYVNENSTVDLKCAYGHEWITTAASIRKGRWCRRCAKSFIPLKYTIQDACRIAKERQGKLLSKAYVNSSSLLLWKCNCGYEWKASLKVIMRPSWCKLCGIKNSAKNRRKKPEYFHNLAKKRRGKCLANKISGVLQKIRWECSAGHQWMATTSQISSGKWCPECNKSLGERICRNLFEHIFQKPFPNSRPDWLLGKYGKNKELDGYNTELKIAFEHHGMHHYKISLYNDTELKLKLQKQSDLEKIVVCKNNNVKLFIIPELFSITKLDKLSNVIKEQAKNLEVLLPFDFNDIVKNFDFNSVYALPPNIQKLELCDQIAKSKGGSCLSSKYIRSNLKLKFQCIQGHIFFLTPLALKAGRWCRACSRKPQLSIKDMQKIAASKGGACISTEYSHSHKKLIWQCGKSHIWEASGASVRNGGSWCRKCSRKKPSHEKK